ncbi:MAG: PadR family transcriptional regulator [Candidatus Izemoplasmatales bacterium]|uniref:PadR family transcriptional regulator n=1 Tax=Hujiaoplasma nucleasis TaxID=2725268 RepID=A0A7L6MZY7_9MOLU|nr:PadR family transcriptional regulator [Hujiaoplasma nucleasis]QLY39560.1 PadR family transcriptional regulator [Hujiaoplasma nucleasis]
MTKNSDHIRGFTDYFILSILEKYDSYGYEIAKIIETVSKENINLNEATLYIALKRLLNEGKISTYKQKNKKGISRRYYRLNDEGKKQLKTFRKEWINLENTLTTLVSGKFKYERYE